MQNVIIKEVPKARLLIMGNLVKDIAPFQQMGGRIGDQLPCNFCPQPAFECSPSLSGRS